MRTAFRRAVLAGIVAGLVYAIWHKVRSRVPASNDPLEWQAAPFPFPPVPRTEPRADPANELAATASDAWVDPVDGACPASHPVKGKLSSGIFHVPGGQNYERTKPDRCYLDAAAADADGLRRSQR